MIRPAILILAAAGLSAPAFAQHAGHATDQPQATPAPPPADPHAGHAMPAQTPAPAPSPEPTPSPTPAPADDRDAGHAMPSVAPSPVPQPASNPHAGHVMPPAEAETAADPHAGHTMAGPSDTSVPLAAPPIGPPPAEALAGPAHAADAAFGAASMARARLGLLREHGGITTYKLMLDRFETRIRDGRDGYAIDAEAWVGGDIDRIWLKSEVEGAFDETAERAEVQALWSHAIDPWFDLQAGIRQDFRPDPERTHLVVGLQGLAPYWFEIDAAAFLSTKGDATARLEAEYDQRLTQQLILQPRVELDFAAQDIAEIGVGSGLSSTEFGLRLRYEIVPEFAPYAGLAYERAFGDTARYRRLEDESVGGWSLLLGIRTWF